MKILLTGAVGRFAEDMLPVLLGAGHEVCLLGSGLGDFRVQKHVTVIASPVGSPKALEVISGGRFDAVVFFFSRCAETLLPDHGAMGALLDALVAMQPAALRGGVSCFVLVTDARVFGSGQIAEEHEQPVPDTLPGLLIKAAEDCFTHSVPRFPRSLILRVGSLYAPNDPECVFGRAAQCARRRQTLILPGTESDPIDYLRAADFAALLLAALAQKVTGVLHARGPAVRTLKEMRAALTEALPALCVQLEESVPVSPTLQGGAAQALGWKPLHDWTRELPLMLPFKNAKAQKRPRLAAAVQSSGKRCLAAFGLSALNVLLSFLLGADGTPYRVVLWCAYAALLKDILGRCSGIAAAAVSLLLFVGSEMLTGGFSNMRALVLERPFGLLLALGLGIGFCAVWKAYTKKRRALEAARESERKQSMLLETLYVQAVRDRDRLKLQAARPLDSYGRIYDITRALNTLQPEQIFLSALNVLENVLENKAVAIYYYKKDARFARMVLHSADMDGLANSPDMTALAALTEVVNKGEVFANRTLLPRYPAFAAPIMLDGEPHALVVLWQASFDQCTLYYKNLFSVTCGLTESAMTRALEYYRRTQTLYIENTQILSEKPFLDSLDVYRRLLIKHACSYLLVRIRAKEELSARELNRRIARAMRSTGIAGRLDSGEYYALLPQATESSLPLIAARFRAQGLSCEAAKLEDEALA